MKRLLLVLMLGAMGLRQSMAVGQVRARSAQGDAQQTAGALTRLNPPVYPPLARQARISGEVEVTVNIRTDGSIDSAVVVSGHPLLKQAALESAQKSQFECNECTDAVTPYSLVYSFELGAEVPTDQPPATSHPGYFVTQSLNRITVVAEPELAIPYFVSTSVRSVRCMYLWRCGSHWGGTDYYYYRVRSAKCLYTWNCGYARRRPATSMSNSVAGPE